MKPLVFKRHGQSRFYDPRAAQYVTTDQLRAWRRQGLAVVIVDNISGEDITQIILGD